MFPDSLTFSVNAVYAAQASCGVPSILDERYYQTLFFLLTPPLYSQSAMATGQLPRGKIHDIYSEKQHLSLVTYRARD